MRDKSMSFPLGYEFSFSGVKGVGKLDLKFQPNKQVYTLIGENGVGKTKLLESLFTVLFFSSKHIENITYVPRYQFIQFDKLNEQSIRGNDSMDYFSSINNPFKNYAHSLPVIYLSAQNRGSIQQTVSQINQLGDKKSRLENYLVKTLNCFQNNSNNLKSLNMDISIEEWIIQRAQSANRFQAGEDNREIEITTLLALLNQIDSRIDAEFLEISGSNRVFIKIEGQKRELSELSSGFTSILKIIQAVVSGYSYFTNEKQIAHVCGIVLIDEIESHLHNQWQVKIIPLLKKLFPNTTFFITTHSSLVISQLEQGEAYRLQRDTDGVVRNHLIEYPSNVSFIDLLNTAFDVDLNAMKVKNAQDDTLADKKLLLNLIEQELEQLGGGQ